MKSLNKIKIILIGLFLFGAAISFTGCKEPDPIYFTPEVTLDDYTPYEEKPPVFGEISIPNTEGFVNDFTLLFHNTKEDVTPSVAEGPLEFFRNGLSREIPRLALLARNDSL